MTPSFTRRQLLSGLGRGAGAGALGAVGVGVLAGTSVRDTLVPEASAGATDAPTDLPKASGRMVVIFLRGGMDGLSAVVPVGDNEYFDSRPTIKVPAESAVALDGHFALHPALAPLKELYDSKHLAIVHALSNGTEIRSHFEAQALVELGGTATAPDGWITRHLATTSPLGDGPIRAVTLSAITPTSLRNCRTCVATPSIDGFVLGGRSGLLKGQAEAIAALYGGDDAAGLEGRVALAALNELGKIATPSTPAAGSSSSGAAADGNGGGSYGPLGAAFVDATRLLSSDPAIEVITIDTGGWDTHRDMGTPAKGLMTSQLSDLGNQLHGLYAALDHANVSDVTIIAISEFGRRLAENGSGGLDHGHGNAMFVLGAGIKGGTVYADWPGLAADRLDEGDLRGTTDYRDVLAEILAARTGNGDANRVFPGRPGRPVGLT